MQPANFPCRHLSLLWSAVTWSCNFSGNLVHSWAEHAFDGSVLRGSLLKKSFLIFLNVNSQNLLMWLIFFSPPDILRTSKNYLPKICNTPSKSRWRLSCSYGKTLFSNPEKNLLGEIYCRSLALSWNVIEKIPTQAWKTGETVGNRIFNGPCKVMLVAGSFSCPSPLPLSSSLCTVNKLHHCSQHFPSLCQNTALNEFSQVNSKKLYYGSSSRLQGVYLGLVKNAKLRAPEANSKFINKSGWSHPKVSCVSKRSAQPPAAGGGGCGPVLPSQHWRIPEVGKDLQDHGLQPLTQHC